MNIIDFAKKYVSDIEGIDDPNLHEFLNENLASSPVWMDFGYLHMVSKSDPKSDCDCKVYVVFDKTGSLFHIEYIEELLPQSTEISDKWWGKNSNILHKKISD